MLIVHSVGEGVLCRLLLYYFCMIITLLFAGVLQDQTLRYLSLYGAPSQLLYVYGAVATEGGGHTCAALEVACGATLGACGATVGGGSRGTACSVTA